MDVIFDMETGDPDDLITLLMLLINPDVQLRAVTCYQGSPIQIGLIKHVLSLANNDSILVGGWNSEEPSELSPYYTSVVGQWPSKKAELTPVEVFKKIYSDFPNIHLLTGAPLTNIGHALKDLPELVINHMTTQGGYIGNLVSPSKKLSKFKDKPSYRTYNLGNDVDAFTFVNQSQQIKHLIFVTKDLCHGFSYTPAIHQTISFSNNPLSQLLNKCLGHYALSGKNKAMHDPLAMLIMIYPELGQTLSIDMNYRIDERGHPVFSSSYSSKSSFGLIDYNEQQTWNKFSSICSENIPKNQFKI